MSSIPEVACASDDAIEIVIIKITIVLPGHMYIVQSPIINQNLQCSMLQCLLQTTTQNSTLCLPSCLKAKPMVAGAWALAVELVKPTSPKVFGSSIT